MRPGHMFIAALSLSLSQCARANKFYLKDQWRGEDFFLGWNWVTEDDPTHGRVNYVSEDEARSKYLAYGMFLLSSSFSSLRSSHSIYFQRREANSLCVQTIGPS